MRFATASADLRTVDAVSGLLLPVNHRNARVTGFSCFKCFGATGVVALVDSRQ